MDLATWDPQGQDLHVVKCVVVGDTGVGKTRLICAHACETRYTLLQLMQTHTPTVWAIDHYRKDREVLERSWTNVEGVRVSLRLWDTFGYHDKDRRFAYGRADVILACFSTVRPRSLRNVVQHWYPEIRRICPGVPIILAGCQVDLRHLYMDKDFINIDKGPFFREITDDDILTPDKGHAVANEIGAHYYETSVLDEQYGIQDVFTNVIRGALINKRNQHFWNMLGNLKRVTKPMCQAPYLPPKPQLPKMCVPPSHMENDMRNLLNNQSFCDVIFVARGVCIQAHKVCLVAASTVFEELFVSDLLGTTCTTNVQSQPAKTHKNGKVLSPTNGNSKSNGFKRSESFYKSHTDTAKLLENEEVETSSLDTAESESETESVLQKQTLNHPAFNAIELQQCEDIFNPGTNIVQTVVTMNDNISPSALQYLLDFLYVGKCPLVSYEALVDIRRTADLLGVKDLSYMSDNLLNNEPLLNNDAEAIFHSNRFQRLRDLIIKKGILSDVVFRVDDGTVLAHKALLMARCDVMLGMFSYNFRESSAKEIQFPGVSRATFTALQEYLYTGQPPRFPEVDCIELIELANRLCLTRLLALTEQYIVNELTGMEKAGGDVAEEVLSMLEIAQLHNADQLADWCLWYIWGNYRNIYKKYSKVIQLLRPENQIYLSKHRWPPLWYLKELDYYEKCLLELERQKPIKTYIRRDSDDIDSGCLGFCGRRRGSPRHTATTTVVS